MAVRKLLLIRGLGHSGSTILDLALGAHPRMLGLGEAVRILRTPAPGEEQRGPARLRAELRHQRLCTCGATAAQCPVWGELLAWLPAHEHLTLEDKFRELLARVERHARCESRSLDWVVESYQDDLELALQALPDWDVRIVFLVRDVRAWVHSRTRDAERKGQSFPAARALARWWWVNRRFERDLRRSGKPVFLLGYEELALSPERLLTSLCAWLELEFAPAMLTPGVTSSSHLLAGNRLRFDPERSRQIRYDGSWLSGPVWPASVALLWPSLARMNRRLVYSNTRSRS